MNYHQVFKSSVLGLGLMTCTLAASAQKIDEQELKVNVDKITNSTQHLKNLEPVTFRYDVSKYKHLKLPTGEQYGFLASNVQPEFPNLVYEASKIYPAGKNSTKTARYSEVQTENLIPMLVAAIKEQQAEIELLKQELNQLKARTK